MDSSWKGVGGACEGEAVKLMAVTWDGIWVFTCWCVHVHFYVPRTMLLGFGMFVTDPTQAPTPYPATIYNMSHPSDSIVLYSWEMVRMSFPLRMKHRERSDYVCWRSVSKCHRHSVSPNHTTPSVYRTRMRIISSISRGREDNVVYRGGRVCDIILPKQVLRIRQLCDRQIRSSIQGPALPRAFDTDAS